MSGHADGARERGSIVGAANLVARAQLRRRRAALAFLVILFALVGGAVTATVAGARRTETSIARFNDSARSAYLQLFIPDPTPSQLDALRHVPNVVAVATARAYYVVFQDASTLNAIAPVDGVLGNDVNRVRVIHGRLANPDAPTRSISARAKLRSCTSGLATRSRPSRSRRNKQTRSRTARLIRAHPRVHRFSSASSGSCGDRSTSAARPRSEYRLC